MGKIENFEDLHCWQACRKVIGIIKKNHYKICQKMKNMIW
jgi:hypothetical protein